MATLSRLAVLGSGGLLLQDRAIEGVDFHDPWESILLAVFVVSLVFALITWEPVRLRLFPPPPEPKPALRLNAGTGLAFQFPAAPDERTQAMAKTDGTEAVHTFITALTVTETTNNARAREVSARIVSANPPPPPGDSPLPHPLGRWPDREQRFGVAPGAYERVTLFRRVELADGTEHMGMPFGYWQHVPSVEFTVEVLMADEPAVTGRFRASKIVSGWQGNLPIYERYPLVEELPEEDQP